MEALFVLLFLLVLLSPFAVAALVALAVVRPEIRDRVLTTVRSASRSLPARLALMVATAVVLLIPLSMVEELRQERGYRLAEVQGQLAQEWGTSQNLVGPALWVPVLDHYEEAVESTDMDGNVKVHLRPRVAQREFLFLPQRLDIRGDVAPTALHRGLYDVLVYNASIQIDASFEPPQLPDRAGHRLEILWGEAAVVVELSDLSAVAAVDALTWQGRSLQPESGTLPGGDAMSGIRAAVGRFDGDEAQVRLELELRGTGALLVGALGETTEVTLGGTWDAPSFTGFTLPRERSVRADGFSGAWSVPGVARPVPRVIELGQAPAWTPLRGHTVGVRLVEPASPYVSVERAITYGMLVIALSLLTFLVIEHGLDLKLHPVQWLVNGLALVVFYLILLATSEHLGFHLAYAVAAAVTTGLVGVYSLVATRGVTAAGAVCASLGVLYASMYVMLRSEDHALLMGTVLVVVALACTMWVTRHLGRARIPPAVPAPDLATQAPA